MLFAPGMWHPRKARDDCTLIVWELQQIVHHFGNLCHDGDVLHGIWAAHVTQQDPVLVSLSQLHVFVDWDVYYIVRNAIFIFCITVEPFYYFLKIMCKGGYVSHVFHFKIVKELHDIYMKSKLGFWKSWEIFFFHTWLLFLVCVWQEYRGLNAGPSVLYHWVIWVMPPVLLLFKEFFFFVALGLELRAYILSHSTALFLWWDFLR
jgi:hypothetical protein